VTDVDVLQFFYGDPTGIFPFLSWDVGMDNPRIEKSSVAPIAASMDVRPGSCPSPFNPNGRGVLGVALVGAPELDVALVDETSLLLTRTDGIGGAVAPNEGPSGPGSVLADVASGASVEPCECGPSGGDGIDDLLLFFRSDQLDQALQLDGLGGGTSLPLTLTGNLLDGTPFAATDCARIVPASGGSASLTVQSNLADVWIDVDAADRYLDAGGFAPFERDYPSGTTVTLTASPVTQNAVFYGWREQGSRAVHRQATYTVPAGGPVTVEALYLELDSGRSFRSVGR
jgi:hypothetical protein